MSKPFRNFRMERLEERQMMAGDVKVNAYANGELIIQEANGQSALDNSIYVRQMGSNTIRVLGTPTADGSISLVNGKQYQDFTFKSGTAVMLKVSLGGGNDTVAINEITRSNTFHVDYINIALDGGDWPGSDKDSVSLTNVSSVGNIAIMTGRDADSVYVYNVTNKNNSVTNTAGALSISTARLNEADIDHVSISNAAIEYSTSVYTGAGADDVKLTHIVTQEMRVDLGDGNNTFLFDDLDVRGPYASRGIELKSGSGNDTGTIRNVKANHVTARLGDGMDDLALDYIRAGKLDVQGEGGTDKLSMTRNIWVDSIFESGWETVNGLMPPRFNPIFMTGTTGATMA